MSIEKQAMCLLKMEKPKHRGVRVEAHWPGLCAFAAANWKHLKMPRLPSLLEYPVLCACSLSRVRLFATPWTVGRQAPLSMEFSRQERWSGLPCPPSLGTIISYRCTQAVSQVLWATWKRKRGTKYTHLTASNYSAPS